MSRKLFFILGIITLLGFSGIGAIIIEYVHNRPFVSIFEQKTDYYFQVLTGIAYGILMSLIAWKVAKSNFLSQVRNHFARFIQDLGLKTYEIVFISFCAGVGEEILFRGSIQPLLGIWVTALIFVALHGYLNPFNWRLSIYGIFMFFIAAGFGYLYEYIGLVSAISAHFAIDVVLLCALKWNKGIGV